MCPFNPEKDHISHLGQIRDTFALSWYGDHFGPFWSVLVHFCAFWCTPCVTPWPLHDLYWLFILSSIQLFQKKIIKVTQDEFDNLLNYHDMVTILADFGPFWCTSWATPWPLSIKFSRSHQWYVSYASRASKRDQSYLQSSICSGDIDQTYAISMGKNG